MSSKGYGRVLLKLSGEVFGGEKGIGVDPDVVQAIAKQIADVVKSGTQVAIVVGGGNYFRGAELQQRGMERSRADYMGMLGTVMNCLALQDFLEKQGIETRVQTAITMGQVAEPYVPRRAMRHLEKGRVVIFGAGAGMPFFTTDTVAAQRALEIGAGALLLAKSGVDGVYNADPRKDSSATKFDTISYDEVLQKSLAVADAAAFRPCASIKRRCASISAVFLASVAIRVACCCEAYCEIVAAVALSGSTERILTVSTRIP